MTADQPDQSVAPHGPGNDAPDEPDRAGVPVTVETFARAETDNYFGGLAATRGLGVFAHRRQATPIDQQAVIRMNRDTLYSPAVFDLDASPVTITLPDSGDRYLSMQLIDQNHSTPQVTYEPGPHTLTRDQFETRYVMALVRTLVDTTDTDDLLTVRAIQDQITAEQEAIGRWEVPTWDQASMAKIRKSLNVLGAHTKAGRPMFGRAHALDRLSHLIGTAAGWGGLPEVDSTYEGHHPRANDGVTPHRITVGEVPVDGFWSVSVYNADGFFEASPHNRYSVNNLTADPDPDGSITIHFGGDDQSPNHLPITPGWNYVVRLYRPGPAILDRTWAFPRAHVI